MTTELPTDFTAWDFKTGMPRRLATGITAAMATMTAFSPGAMTATFNIPTLLARMGKGNCPETASVATSVTGWEDVAAAGFKMPVELTTERIGYLDAHATATWVVYQRIEFPYAHPSTNAASNWTQLSTWQLYHALVEDGSHDQERGPLRVRVNNTAGGTQGHFQTNLVAWNGSVASQSSITHSSITLATLGADAGGVAVELLIEFGYDPAMAALGSAYPYNIRITARSTSLDDGSVHQAATQSDHYGQLGTYPTLPRLPGTLCGTESYATLGRSKDTTGTPHGMNGDFTLMFETVRDAASGMLNVTQAGEWMDYFRDSAPLVENELEAAHAWTGEPDHLLEDVAVGGSFDLTESGSGTAVAYGSEPIPGLPDRFRGYEITANWLVAASGLNAEVAAALADGKTVLMLSAVNLTTVGTTAIAFYEFGSTANSALFRHRKAVTSTNLQVTIQESGSTATCDGPTGAVAGMTAGDTVLQLVQVCASAEYHQDESAKQTVVLDTMSEAGVTRTVLYPDESPASQAMSIPSDKPLTIGASQAGLVPLLGRIVLAVFYLDDGEIKEQWEANNIMEGWFSDPLGLQRWTGGGGARNRSRSRARAGAF